MKSTGFHKESHFSLRSLNYRLQVHTEGDVPDFNQWWEEAIVTVPGLVREADNEREGWELYLIFDETQFDFQFLPDKKRVLYRGRPQFQEIGLLISSIFERIYSEDGSFTLHASAIQTSSGKGWIFFGETFSGKTAAVLNLRKRIPGLKYIANERVLISKDASIIEGTGAVRIKPGDYPDLSDKDRELYGYGDFYDQRIHESSIDKIIQIKLFSGVQQPYIKSFTWKRSMTTLYGHLGEVLGNTFLLLDNLSRPVPGFGDPDLNLKRVQLARNLASRSHVTHFAGDINDLAAYIAEEDSCELLR
jgi:hypothetical protein